MRNPTHAVNISPMNTSFDALLSMLLIPSRYLQGYNLASEFIPYRSYFTLKTPSAASRTNAGSPDFLRFASATS